MPNNIQDITPERGAVSAGMDKPVDQNNKLTGDEFAGLIRRKETLDFSGYRISGDADLTGVAIGKPLEIQNAVFTGTVNFSQAKFKRGVDLTGCRFEQKLILSDACVEGPLKLDNVIIGGADAEPIPDIERLKLIIASLKEGCRRVRSSRRDADDVRTLKRALLRRRCVSRRRYRERLAKEKAEYPEPQTVAEFDNLRVTGSVSMMKTKVLGGLSCKYAKIESDFRADGARICGNLSLMHASMKEFRTDWKPPLADTDAKRSKPEPFQVDGTLDFTSAKVNGDLRLVGIIIGGRLTLQAAEISGNLLCRPSARVRSRLRNGAQLLLVRIKGHADFSGTQLRGGLYLETGNIGGSLLSFRSGRWFLDIRGVADIHNVHVGADIYLVGCRVRGDVLLSGARIENNLVFIGVDFEKNLNLNSVAVNGELVCNTVRFFNRKTRVGGDVYLIGARFESTVSFEGAYLGRDLLLQNASISGMLFIRTASLSPGNNVRCEIARKAWLLGVTVTGDIDISGTRIGDDLVLQNANIGQNLRARLLGGFQTQIDGDAYLNGARVRGSIAFGGALLKGELNMDGVSVDGGIAVTYDMDETNNLQIEGSHVYSTFHAESATIGKNVDLMGLIVGPDERTPGAPTAEGQGVIFTGAQINGEFALYSKEFVNLILKSKEVAFQGTEVTAETKHQLIEQSRQMLTVIQGDLRLTRAQVLGGVSLDGLMLEGELDLRDATVRANISCRPIEIAPGEFKHASVRRADFETLDMTGDINLTGLTIGGGQREGDGDLILRDSRIRGRLELYPFERAQHPTDSGEDRNDITIIRGTLRLDAAEISHVTLSGSTFKEPDQAQAGPPLAGENAEAEREARVVLERGTIGRLQIVKPLPGTLDLSNLKVDRLDNLEDATSYQDMLEKSIPFKKSNYLTIENALRNAGNDEHADAVHVLMRRRDRRQTKSFWKRSFDTFLDLSIKYGTTSKRIVGLMLLLFALSVWVFRDPNHVEYEIAPAAQKPPPSEHPANWNVIDAALFAAGLHVPIISLGVKEEVQPSGRKLKAYAMAVVAIHWVMWPLLIASLSGFIRKRH